MKNEVPRVCGGEGEGNFGNQGEGLAGDWPITMAKISGLGVSINDVSPGRSPALLSPSIAAIVCDIGAPDL